MSLVSWHLHPSTGKCSGTFDAAFDWVRTLNNGRKVYSSYFFRNGWAWLYDNSNAQPRNGEPRSINAIFKGVPSNIDVVVQIRPRKNANDNLDDNRHDMYFFKGKSTHLYWSGSEVGVYGGWRWGWKGWLPSVLKCQCICWSRFLYNADTFERKTTVTFPYPSLPHLLTLINPHPFSLSLSLPHLDCCRRFGTEVKSLLLLLTFPRNDERLQMLYQKCKLWLFRGQLRITDKLPLMLTWPWWR